jgi:hypothetical protein
MSDRARTIVQPMTEDRYGYKPGMFGVCIDEQAGCDVSHYHEYGHDFPVTREELMVLRTQIDAALGAADAEEGGE